MWSTPRTLGHGTNSPVPMVDTGVRRKRARVARGLLVDPSGRWTRAGVARDSWSTPRALGYGPESPGASGRPRGTSGMGANLPGQLVDRGRQARTRVARKIGPHRGPKGMGRCRPGQLVNPECLGTRAPFTRDSWLTPRALGHKRECPGTAGRPLGTRRRAGVARDSLSTPQALGPKCEWPGSAG